MDAPGHKDFVPRVIGGASQADAAVLVVNATNGEFETGFGPGGQTREHARLARLLGVSRLIVAVNKMDTVNWSQARFDQIQSQLSHFLKGMNITAVDFCPVSGLTGVNLVSKSAAKTEKYSEGEVGAALFTWYHGPCLLDIIDSIPSPDRTVDGPFRFVVSDIFKPAGLGVPAVAGRVLSGGVSSGLNAALSRVFCQPSGLPATVKSIRSLCTVRSGSDHTEGAEISGGFLDQVVKSAFSGDQVALILNGIDPFQSLVPGDVIADPDNPVPLASRISAKVLVFTVPQPITQGYPVIFYYHCTSIGAHITRLKSMTHKENKMMKTVKKPRCLLGNCTADVEITLERPVCLEVYERCKPLGRFMLRVNGESVAGGTVTAVLPSKKNRLVDF
ncbi:Eukaryotic release factor 3 (Erfs) (Hbs1) [Fasciola gigantica]|uniref:Eukaryotic release factor 3 (Erfs) (Hbs1) n=1 Tax=Fasciola gigantica TaxID=46835 RepID=A0A504YKQ8_FASGI|nr:Eukaryotic release factor 3 (Erfs) (Hbs1) [Fasciola gigantica]